MLPCGLSAKFVIVTVDTKTQWRKNVCKYGLKIDSYDKPTKN